MRRIVNSRVTRFVAFMLAFFSGIFVFSAAYTPYGYYMRLNNLLIINDSLSAIIVTLTICLPSLLVYFTSVLLSNGEAPKPIGKIVHGYDLVLFGLLVHVLLFVDAYVLLKNRDIYTLLLTPFIAYAMVIAWITTIIRRMGARTFTRTVYWMRFYKAFPVHTITGACATLLGACSLFWLILSLSYRQWIGAALAMATFMILTYAARYFAQLADIGRIIDDVADRSGALLIEEDMFIRPLRPYVRRLGEISGTYERSMMERVKAERFKTDLITNVSHDIRTPLTSIINYVDLVGKLPIDDAALRDYTAVLQKKSERLKVLIEDLMDASKAGSGSIAVTMERIDIVEMIGQIAGEFDEPFLNKSLQFVFTQGDAPLCALADGRHLWRVMENLFSNVVKYSMPSTRVYASLQDAGETVVFTLKNISQEALGVSAEELTQQFVRGDRARHGEGSGLGLYIAQSLAEVMGGQLTLSISGDLFEAAVTLTKSV